jgi:hypothetical protein
MAKELEKFKADLKKLDADIKAHSAERAAAAWQKLRMAKSNCDTGEDHMKESLVDAREEGVTGDTLADFMKSKSFAEAKKLLDVTVRDLVAELKSFDDFCTNAEKTALKVGTINTAIQKDLKGRKDKSESKKEIQALQESTYEIYQELMKSNAFKDKPNKATRDYVANYAKTIKSIIETAPEEAQRQKDATMLPQLLVDRNLKRNLGLATSGKKKVDELCDQAIEAAGDNLSAAAPFLKEAQTELNKVKEIKEDYEKIATQYKDAVEVSKDKSKIEKAIKMIAASHEEGERKLRGTVTVIKKAG